MTVREASKAVRSTSGPKKILLETVLQNEFLSKHSAYTVDTIFDNSNVVFTNQAEFDALDVECLDKIIHERTDFSSWVQYLQAAVDYYQL